MSRHRPHRRRRLLLLAWGLLLALGAARDAGAILGEVVVAEGGESEFLHLVSGRITDVVNSLEKGTLVACRDHFTPAAYTGAAELLGQVPMANARPVHETDLVTLPDGRYEVRDIRVRVEMGGTEGSPYQYLVFQVDGAGLIDDVHFSMEAAHYNRLLEEGADIEDFARRQEILQFLEIFRTAHNRKDLSFLRSVYSDDALIIVGRVVERGPEQTDMMQSCFRDQGDIQFIRRSKAEYIDQLDRVFQRNDFIRVVFDQVEISRHFKDPDIYGVTLKQSWQSSSYSDEGFLFLMVDFLNVKKPLIHVRSWQPQPFPDGTVMSLYDFQIID